MPEDFFAGGALLPLGGHKGYGLGVMVELLAGLLSGNSASFLPDFVGGNGVLVMVIRPDAFMPIDQYLAQVEHACAALKAAPSMDATRPVLLPGEPEQLARVERTANGIPMAEATWQSLSESGGQPWYRRRVIRKHCASAASDIYTDGRRVFNTVRLAERGV